MQFIDTKTTKKSQTAEMNLSIYASNKYKAIKTMVGCIAMSET